MVEQNFLYHYTRPRRGRGQSPTVSFRLCLWWSKHLPQGFTSQKFHYLLVMPCRKPSLQHTSFWDMFKIQTITSGIDILILFLPIHGHDISFIYLHLISFINVLVFSVQIIHLCVSRKTNCLYCFSHFHTTMNTDFCDLKKYVNFSPPASTQFCGTEYQLI
jgi:hypothetical protein